MIDEQTLLAERKVLESDFNTMSDRIKQVDAELIQMKSNLNAVHGAIQQVDKFIKMSENNKKIPDEKEKALNIATG